MSPNHESMSPCANASSSSQAAANSNALGIIGTSDGTSENDNISHIVDSPVDAATENASLPVDLNVRTSSASLAASSLSGKHAKGLRSPQLAKGQSPSPASSVADVLRLGDLLRDECEKAAFSEHSEVLYLPHGALERLICPDYVKLELETHFPRKSISEIGRLVTTICQSTDRPYQSYRRVFAVVAMADALDFLDKILDPEEGISDNDLPLLRVDSHDRKAHAYLRRDCDWDKPIRCFKGWGFNKVKLFDDWQWSLQAPILEPISENYPTFHVRVPLPVQVKISPGEGGGTGGFSEVFKVKLHPRHHPFSPDDEESFFALKKLKATDDSIFEQELLMLRKFEKRNAHPHIIPLLTAWRQGDYSYFLLPWAECDLLKYWEVTSPVMNHDFVCWIARQLEGLTAGLNAIHEYTNQDADDGNHEPQFGRHGDIKPENILLFKTTEQAQGKLVISDFGFGVFNSRRSRSNLPSKDIACTPTYRPPESAIQGGKVSRSWDIWTLGCVYAELVTWLLGGWQLTEDFADWRMTTSTIFGPAVKLDEFFELVEIFPQKDGSILGTGAMVKPKVTRWFQGLHNHKHCTQFTHDILALVEDKMLIVESAIQKRASSQVILHALRSLVDRCAVDEEYCTKPTPRELPVESVNEKPAVMVTLSDDAREVAHRNRASLRAYSGPTEEPATVD